MGCYEAVYVGIVEQETDQLSNILIYPNPASDYISIRYRIPDTGYHVWIFDGSGKLMDNCRITDSQEELKMDVSAYLPGIYLLIIHGDDGVLSQKKLIIK